MFIEKFDELFKKAPEAAELVIENAKTLINYANFTMEHSMQKQALYSGSQSLSLKSDFESMDKKRIAMHDMACEACAQINSMAERVRMKPIFNFELEPIQSPYMKYSHDNHFKVANFVGQFINEYYHFGSKEYNRHIFDQVTSQDKLYDENKLNTMPRKSEIGVDYINRSDIKPILKENPNGFEVRLADGATLIVKAEKPIDTFDLLIRKDDLELPQEYNVELISKNPYSRENPMGTQINEMAGQNAFYFDLDNKAYDVPTAVIQEIVDRHGGFEDNKYRQEKGYERD